MHKVTHSASCNSLQKGNTNCKNGKFNNYFVIIRLIKEDDKYKIYISTENSKEYHEWDLQFLEIDKDFIPAVKKIIKRYPEFIYVRDLPLKDKDDRVRNTKCFIFNAQYSLRYIFLYSICSKFFTDLLSDESLG